MKNERLSLLYDFNEDEKDEMSLEYVPSTPEFWQRMNILKPSGLMIRCYFYIAGRTSLWTAISRDINYKNMAEDLGTKYNSLRPCLAFLEKHEFILKIGKRYEAKFLLPDIQRVRDINDERKHRSQARTLQKRINEALYEKQKATPRQLENSERAYVVRKTLMTKSEGMDLKKVVPYLNLPDMFDESSKDSLSVTEIVSNLKESFSTE